MSRAFLPIRDGWRDIGVLPDQHLGIISLESPQNALHLSNIPHLGFALPRRYPLLLAFP